jgi:hypoxanthine phosphoribosyltransferase
MRELAVSKKDIENVTKALAECLNKEYKGQSVIFIGVLNGCFMFFSDLMKQIELDCEIDFISVKSYSNNKQVTFELIKNITLNIKDKVVILIDDVFDSGATKEAITGLLGVKNPREIKWCFLLAKNHQPTPDCWIGVTLHQNWFVYGYGLDNNGKDRNLQEIYYDDNED